MHYHNSLPNLSCRLDLGCLPTRAALLHMDILCRTLCMGDARLHQYLMGSKAMANGWDLGWAWQTFGLGHPKANGWVMYAERTQWQQPRRRKERELFVNVIDASVKLWSASVTGICHNTVILGHLTLTPLIRYQVTIIIIDHTTTM